MIPALRITVKPALGDHPFVKLSGRSKQVVGEQTVAYWDRCCHCYEFVAIVNMCKRQSADTVVISAKRRIIGQYRLSADYWCISNFITLFYLLT